MRAVPLLLQVPKAAFQWALEMVRIGGDIDFVAATAGWPDWIKQVAHFIIAPPSWFPTVLSIIGVALLISLKFDWPRKKSVLDSLPKPDLKVAMRQAEARANRAIRTQKERGTKEAAAPYPNDSGTVVFDYSTHNGTVRVGSGDKQFGIKFSSASNNSIHLYGDGAGIRRIARAKGVRSGDKIAFPAFDSSSRHYTIHRNEHFLVENTKGFFLQGRINDIKCESHGDPCHEVQFDYQINPDGGDDFNAL